MEIEARVASVEKTETRNGDTRYVVRDDEGREFTTFRPGVGEQAAGLEPFKRLVADDIRQGGQRDE
jgi:hypothetical protein